MHKCLKHANKSKKEKAKYLNFIACNTKAIIITILFFFNF